MDSIIHTYIYIVIHSLSHRHLCNAPGPKQRATDMKLRRRQGLAERLLNPLGPGKRRQRGRYIWQHNMYVYIYIIRMVIYIINMVIRLAFVTVSVYHHLLQYIDIYTVGIAMS